MARNTFILTPPTSKSLAAGKSIAARGIPTSGKKCIPGIICIENMTLFVLVLIFGLLIYMFVQIQKPRVTNPYASNPYTIPPTATPTASIFPNFNLAGFGLSTRSDPFNDPYAPPLKTDGLYFPADSGDMRGVPAMRSGSGSMMGVTQYAAPDRIAGLPVAVTVSQPVIPINVQTRSFSAEYTQIGILTRDNGSDMILPLMGRRTMNGRDRYQYYTISNTGSVNTKLPVKVNGKSCGNEYGCNEIMSGDIVFVEGYKETFQATVYENSLLSYIPYL